MNDIINAFGIPQGMDLRIEEQRMKYVFADNTITLVFRKGVLGNVQVGYNYKK